LVRVISHRETMAGPMTWHVSCSSDKWSGSGDPYENYIGFVLGMRGNDGEWITQNGTHVKTGYIVFLKTRNVDQSRGNTLHGKAYYRMFGENIGDVRGIGFSYQPLENPMWKGTSRTFNDIEIDHHTISDDCLNEIKKCLRQWNRTGHQNFARHYSLG